MGKEGGLEEEYREEEMGRVRRAEEAGVPREKKIHDRSRL